MYSLSDDEDDIDINLDPGEKKYGLGVAILWDENIHGSYPDNINNHWIVMNTMKLEEFFQPGSIEDLVNYFNYYINQLGHNVLSYLSNPIPEFGLTTEEALSLFEHRVYPNYFDIINDSRYISLEIYEIHCLSSWETIGIRKTFWIRLIQRRWKKLYKERLDIIKKRKAFESLRYRQINGQWPNKLKHLPSIRDIINF